MQARWEWSNKVLKEKNPFPEFCVKQNYPSKIKENNEFQWQKLRELVTSTPTLKEMIKNSLNSVNNKGSKLEKE